MSHKGVLHACIYIQNLFSWLSGYYIMRYQDTNLNWKINFHVSVHSADKTLCMEHFK